MRDRDGGLGEGEPRMTDRRFYLVRWKTRHMVFASRWVDCGHRHRFLKNAARCAEARRGEVFEVTERRRIVWEPTYSCVEEAP